MRTVVVSQNITLDGSIEMLGDWSRRDKPIRQNSWRRCSGKPVKATHWL
jgi:hypothetical protein